VTITVVPPVAGLPEGPATEATVKANLNIALDDTADDKRLELTINAANSVVAALPLVADLSADVDEWPGRIVLGATLLASRWFKRSNSPAGVVDLGGEAGVVYVQRNDPDIGMMLGLGAYARPSVG